MFDISGKKIWIAGHSGLVGAALVSKFSSLDCKILTASRAELDLTRQEQAEDWISLQKPDVIIIAAAKVGGIGENAAKPAEFIFDNLAIAQNIIHGAYRSRVQKLVFLGSSCIYPKFAEQPIREEELLSGGLESTNEAYAIAKIAGIKLCQFYRRQYGCDFISLMPCNIYGPNDRWAEARAHVIPAVISRLHKAKMEELAEVEIWGSGKPMREFLHADDLAAAVFIALRNYSEELHLNCGSGEEISIYDLARMIAGIVGYEGELRFNQNMPDGTPRKILDSGRLRDLGWTPEIDLEIGLKAAYRDFLNFVNHI
ncbi:MAG: GDP-fucose synthetase [Micavibrio aeruginosavorus]|uniref:GDP-L-fucose synthase n=1 Tax=Micavibrio aeruginosavorus TaxID=349221 RepID=A0A2W5FLD4_9BACT|nr:MAG: GDP-fucose synthetase [Micavibrio aeruginosavorus]